MQETETEASDGEALSKPYAPCGAEEEQIIKNKKKFYS
jgi:hypothetical protein